MNDLLFYFHYALLLAFGIVLSFVFSGSRFTKKSSLFMLLLFLFSGTAQLLVYNYLGETLAWKLYPVFSHLPLILVLSLLFKKRLSKAASSITLAYLFCQPSKWFGLFIGSITGSENMELSVRIVSLLVVGYVSIVFISKFVSKIYSNDTSGILVFSTVPIVYYLSDYLMGIYTDVWTNYTRMAGEFISFVLCVFFVVFCVVYYKEYEKKSEAQRKEAIVSITVQQQKNELAAIRKSIAETRLLRHDMRMLLSRLKLSIEQDDKENSIKMISGFISQVESSSLSRFCDNDTVNYILTDYSDRCRDAKTKFDITVELNELTVDEVMFSSIISNALDNALNAQEALPEEKRHIELMIKKSGEKILLSVRNPFEQKPTFSEGVPVTTKRGHGYGVQSIRYMTEKLGGKYQFSTENDIFILRVVI